MKRIDMHWMDKKEWWEVKDNVPVVKNDAPQEAQESYKHYLEQINKDDRFNLPELEGNATRQLSR